MQNDESSGPKDPPLASLEEEARDPGERQLEGGHRPRTMTARYPAVGPAAWGAVEDARFQHRRATQRLFAVVQPPARALDLGEIEDEVEAPTVSRRAIVVPPPTLLSGDAVTGSATMREEPNDE
jgi:hypothetical protein